MTDALGDTLFAWQVYEGGAWGLIGAQIEGLGMSVLVHRDRRIVERMRPVAEAHGRASGHPVRLAMFALAPDANWDDLDVDECPGCQHGRVRYCPVHGLHGTAPR